MPSFLLFLFPFLSLPPRVSFLEVIFLQKKSCGEFILFQVFTFVFSVVSCAGFTNPVHFILRISYAAEIADRKLTISTLMTGSRAGAIHCVVCNNLDINLIGSNITFDIITKCPTYNTNLSIILSL